jgi:hypothetical protein
MISVSIVVRPPFTVWSYRYGDVPGPPPYTVQIQSEDAEIADRLRVRRPSRFLASVVGVGEDRVDQQIAVEQGPSRCDRPSTATSCLRLGATSASARRERPHMRGRDRGEAFVGSRWNQLT